LWRKQKKNFPNIINKMKGPRRKPLMNQSLSSLVLSKVRCYRLRFTLIYLYLRMPIEPHYLGLFLEFKNIIWRTTIEMKCMMRRTRCFMHIFDWRSLGMHRSIPNSTLCEINYLNLIGCWSRWKNPHCLQKANRLMWQ